LLTKELSLRRAVAGSFDFLFSIFYFLLLRQSLYLALNAVFDFVSRKKGGLKGAKTAFLQIFAKVRSFLAKVGCFLALFSKSWLSRGGRRGFLVIN